MILVGLIGVLLFYAAFYLFALFIRWSTDYQTPLKKARTAHHNHMIAQDHWVQAQDMRLYLSRNEPGNVSKLEAHIKVVEDIRREQDRRSKELGMEI